MHSLPKPRFERDPLVFVVGCPSSGTSLLQHLLSQHPDLAVANESQHIALGDIPPSASADVPLTPERLDGLRTRQVFLRLGLNEDAVRRVAAETGTYRAFAARIYAAFAAAQGKRLSGALVPEACDRLADLHALFPESRIVHVVRDGRNVAISAFEWAKKHNGPGRLELWAENPIGASALWWRAQVGAARAAGRALGNEHYYELQYEHLTGDPDLELRCVSAYLHLPFVTEMTGRGRAQGGPAMMPPTAGLCDWRRQMRADDVALFEALAGDQLEALGYPLAGIQLSPEVARRADRCRAWWARYETTLRPHEPHTPHINAA